MTRLEWKIEKIRKHIPYNLETLRIPMLVILIVAGVTALAPITYSMATESIQEEIKQNTKKQQEKLLEEQKQKEIDKQIEEDKKQKEYLKEQQKKKAKEEHDTSVYYFKKSYKVGDRIKILDMNYTVPEGDSFRFSVGDIDVIAAINYENLTMQGESGYTYCYGVQVQKVQSKREWRDLVEMKDKKQLKFYEVNEDE